MSMIRLYMNVLPETGLQLNWATWRAVCGDVFFRPVA